MTCNVGIIDKVIRVIAGLGLLLYGVVTAPQTGSFAIAIVGLVLLITALISFCPLYAILGINTSCKRNA